MTRILDNWFIRCQTSQLLALFTEAPKAYFDLKLKQSQDSGLGVHNCYTLEKTSQLEELFKLEDRLRLMPYTCELIRPGHPVQNSLQDEGWIRASLHPPACPGSKAMFMETTRG